MGRGAKLLRDTPKHQAPRLRQMPCLGNRQTGETGYGSCLLMCGLASSSERITCCQMGFQWQSSAGGLFGWGGLGMSDLDGWPWTAQMLCNTKRYSTACV